MAVRLAAPEISQTGRRYRRWACRCDCGSKVMVRTENLRNGDTKSCGCYVLDVLRDRALTHGETRNRRPTREYNIWVLMLGRCRNPNNPRYARYGGRGIVVCPRWLNFENFIADMGRSPSPQHSIDRIDNDGNYEPTNCRWATLSEQAQNRGDAWWIEFGGERMKARDWARRLGVAYGTLESRRRRGLSGADLLSSRQRARPGEGRRSRHARPA